MAVREYELESVSRLSLERLAGLGIDSATPESRTRMAAVYAGAAAFGTLGILAAPTPAMAVPVAAAVAACLRWAWRAWLDSQKPLYLNPSSAGLPLDAWRISPGTGIGPFELGPAGSDTLMALKRSRACWFQHGAVTYLFASSHGWLAVCLTTDQKTPRRDEPPDVTALRDVVWVETSCPFHSTPEGVSPGSSARDVAMRLGPPLDTSSPVWGDLHLHYYGLRVALRKGRVQTLRVLPRDPVEALQPWCM
jgi:hypothetical protein